MPSAPPPSRSPARRYGGLSAGERVAARRARLLDAALELYGTRGFAATGVKDVCRAAGLTDRYFYESFRNAGELHAAVLDRTTEELLALVARRVAAAPPDPDAQARAAIDGFVRALADDPRKARLVFGATASADDAVARHMRATLRRFAALVADTARPHLSGDADEQALQIAALALVGAIDRVLIEWQEGELDATIEQLVDRLAELFAAVGAAVGWRPARGA